MFELSAVGFEGPDCVEVDFEVFTDFVDSSGLVLFVAEFWLFGFLFGGWLGGVTFTGEGDIGLCILNFWLCILKESSDPAPESCDLGVDGFGIGDSALDLLFKLSNFSLAFR